MARYLLGVALPVAACLWVASATASPAEATVDRSSGFVLSYAPSAIYRGDTAITLRTGAASLVEVDFTFRRPTNAQTNLVVTTGKRRSVIPPVQLTPRRLLARFGRLPPHSTIEFTVLPGRRRGDTISARYQTTTGATGVVLVNVK